MTTEERLKQVEESVTNPRAAYSLGFDAGCVVTVLKSLEIINQYKYKGKLDDAQREWNKMLVDMMRKIEELKGGERE